MKCYECGGTYRETTDLLIINDPYVGQMPIKGIPYYTCDKCQDILYTEEMSKAIEVFRDDRINELIRNFPVDAFLSTNETIDMLGISRQALHKNRRISKGFIYSTNIGNLTVYLKKSVLQFKETGDGRFPLQLREHTHRPEYIKDTVPIRNLKNYEGRPRPIKYKNPFTEDEEERVIPKEYTYAN